MANYVNAGEAGRYGSRSTKVYAPQSSTGAYKHVKSMEEVKKYVSPSQQDRIQSYNLHYGGVDYNLTQSQVDWMRDRYQKSFADYYKGTPDDLDRMTSGRMPSSFERSYGNNDFDKKLYELGLPSSKYLAPMMQDYATWYGDGASYQFDKDASDYISTKFKKSWVYSYTAEDQQRKAQGLPPISLAKKYQDTYTDNDLYNRGLPSQEDLGKYYAEYEQNSLNKSRINEFNSVVADEILRAGGSKAVPEDQRKQMWFDKLMSPEWADVAALYKDTKKPDEIDQTKYTLPNGMPDVESYNEARLKAYNEQQELESSIDAFLSYGDFEKVYPQMEVSARRNNLVDSAIESVYSVPAPTAYDSINDRKSTRSYIDSLPADSDPVSVMQDLYSNGVDIGNVRQARNYLMSKYSGSPYDTEEEVRKKKEERARIKDAFDQLQFDANGKLGNGEEPSIAGAVMKGIAASTMMQGSNAESISAAMSLNETASQDFKTVLDKSSKARENRKNVVAEVMNNYSRDVFTTVSKEDAISTYKQYATGEDGKTSADGVEAAKEALAAMGLNNREIGLVEDEIDAERASSGGFLERLASILPDTVDASSFVSDTYQPDPTTIQNERWKTKAGQGEAEDMKEVLAIAREKFVSSGKGTDFEFDQAARQEGYSALLDPEEQTKNYYLYVEAPRSGATLEEAEQTWNSLDDQTRTSLSEQFVNSLFTNPDIAKTDAEILAYQGIGSIVPKAAAGIVSGTVSSVDMLSSVFGGRTDQWQFTKTVNDFSAKIQNAARSNQTLFSQGVSLASDVGAEVAKMYALNAAGNALSGAFTSTKIGGAISTAAAAKSASGTRLLSKLALHTVQSTPFMVNAAGQYYTEAVKGGATLDQARVYGLVCGGMEGLVEAFNADKIWGKVFGAEKIGKSIVKGADKTLSSNIVAKSRMLSLVTSFLGEYTEESAGYAFSLAAGSLQGWNDDQFSWNELNAQGLMGGLIGILGGASSLSNVNEASLVADYMIKSGDYSADNYDVLFSAAFRDNMSKEQIDQYNALGYNALLTKDDHAAVVADIVQASKDYHAAENKRREVLSAIDKDYSSKKRAVSKAKKHFDLLVNDGVDQASDEFRMVREELMSHKTPQELKAIRDKAKQEAENDYASSVFTSNRAMEKASTKLRAHHVVLASVFQNEIDAMKLAVASSELDTRAYKQFVESYKGVDAAVMSGQEFDADKYDQYVSNMGNSFVAAEAVTKSSEEANSVLSGMSEKMRQIRAGNAQNVVGQQEQQAQAEATPAEPQPAAPEPTVQEPAASSTTEVQMSDSEKQEIYDMAKRLGKEVEFRNLDSWVDGVFDNGKIILNEKRTLVNGDTAVVSAAKKVLVHELTHSIEGTEQYNAFSQFAIDQTVKNVGMDEESLYSATRDIYLKASNGTVDLSPALARRELVARYAEQNFLTNDKAIDTLVREQSGVAYKVLNWIQYQIGKLNARFSSNPEAATLLTAERLYIKAFTAAGKKASDGFRQYKAAMPDASLEQYVNGASQEAPTVSVSFSLADGLGTPFEEALKSYSQKAQGMNPRAREVAVPEQIGEGVYVSDVIRSALESSHVTDFVAPKIEQAVADQDFGVHARMSNEQTRENAQDLIARRGGVTKAYEYFKGMIEEKNVNAFNGADVVALGEQLLAEYSKEKNTLAQMDIISDLCILGTQTGRMTQAFAMLKMTGAVGRQFYMQKMVKSLNEKYFGKNAAKYDTGDVVSVGDALYGTSGEIKVDSALYDALAIAKTEDEMRVAEDAILRKVASQIPLTPAQAWSNWRYFSMLANPVTHMRNIVGNAMMFGARKASDAVAYVLEKTLKPEDRTKAIYDGRSAEEQIKVSASMFDKYKKDVISGGKFGFEQELRRYMRYSNKEVLDWAMRLNSDLLEKEDEEFMKPVFVDAFTQYMIAQKINPARMTEEQEASAAKIAIEQAKKATFRDNSPTAALLQQISDSGVVGQLAVEGLFPFKKTTLNIAKRMVEYSPAGVFQSVYMALEGAKSGKYTPSQTVERLSSGLVGSTLTILGFILGKAGLLRGGGEDKDNAESYMQSTGRQKYSIDLNGVSVGLSNIPPTVVPLFLGVQLADLSEGKGLSLKDFAEAAVGIADPLMEMSFMASLNNALNSYNTEESVGGAVGSILGNAAMSYASQYLPTLGGKIAQFADDTTRTAKSSKASPVGTTLDYWARSQAKKVPILENQLEPNVDQLGRTQVKDTFGEWALDFFNKFVFPMSVKVKSKDAIDNELVSVFEQTGNTNAIPVLPQKYFMSGGVQYPLTAKQYTAYSEDYGTSVYNAVGALISSSAYQNASPDNKAIMLEGVIGKAEETIRDKWKFIIISEEGGKK